MSLFLVEYKTCVPGQDGKHLSVHVPLEADTLQIAQREVERVVASGCVDEAVLYQPVKVISATRVVNSTEMSGKGVVIGSALLTQREEPVTP